MAEHFYFAYGSNMNPLRVQQRKMAYTHIELAKLDDYSLAFNKRSTKVVGASSANVMSNPGGEVQGLLYHLSDDKQILMMDPFEGYPIRYDRHLLPVNTVSGIKQVWVYIANKDYVEAGLKPARWYLNHLLCGREYLEPNYYSDLANVSCLENLDTES